MRFTDPDDPCNVLCRFEISFAAADVTVKLDYRALSNGL